jgi:inner membrane transporter RhtA
MPKAALAVSAIFHYLGPALANLLFAHFGVIEVAWLRIASAAVVFAAWRRPWRNIKANIPLGVVLALMNTVFYLAIARLPLSTVGAVEFLGVVLLATLGVRSRRNALALVLAVGGVFTLADIRIVDQSWGFVFAFVNCALFVLYVVLGHRLSGNRVDQLGGAMIVAAVLATPFGASTSVFDHPLLLLAGVGVGICSSVIPYVIDQYAMARMPRATFALMLCLLPAMATVIGLAVLGQVPTVQDLAGIALVIAGVALHQEAT